MASISINKMNLTGKSVKIINGKIIIDGVEHKSDDKIINITIDGDIDNFNIDSCNDIKITGNVKGNVNSGIGDVKCGDVTGDVTSSTGDVSCGNIQGNVKTSTGDVTCEGNIYGDVKTSTGDIKYKKTDKTQFI